jgi:hypothetical protein
MIWKESGTNNSNCTSFISGKLNDESKNYQNNTIELPPLIDRKMLVPQYK